MKKGRVPKIVETHRIRHKGTRTRGNNKNPMTMKTTRTTLEAAGEDREPHIYYTLPLGLLSGSSPTTMHSETPPLLQRLKRERASEWEIRCLRVTPSRPHWGHPSPSWPRHSRRATGAPHPPLPASQADSAASPSLSPPHNIPPKRQKLLRRKPNPVNGLLIWKVSNTSRLFGSNGRTAFFKKSFPGKRLSAALRANRGRVPPPSSVPRVARRRTEGIRIQGIVDNPGDTNDQIVRVSQSDPAWDLAQGRKKRKRQETPQDGDGDEVNPLPSRYFVSRPIFPLVLLSQ